MNSTFVFPPMFKEVHKPYISLPSLIGYLRRDNENINGIDSNINFYEYITSLQGIKELKAEADKLYHVLERKGKLQGNDLIKYSSVSWLAKCPIKGVYDIVTNSKNTLRTEKFYDTKKYITSQNVLNNLTKIVDALILSDDNKLDIAPYNNKETLIEIIEERRYNPYKLYYENYLIPSIDKQKPKYIDITIDFNSQFLPALYLAKKLRDLYEDSVFITFSGDVCPRLSDALPKLDFLFKYANIIILYDREEIINQIIDGIKNNNIKQIRELPNISFYNNENVVLTTIEAVNCINEWNTVDYTDMPLDLYYSPEFEATVYTSYGCYFRKCKFCNIYLRCLEYNERGIDRIIQDVKLLKEKYDIKLLAFGDEEVKVERLAKIAKSFLDNEFNIKWSAQVRFEEGLTEQVCKLFKDSGCIYLGFGLESGSNTMLKKMDTGTNKVTIRKVLNNLNEAKIISNVSLVIGYPGETSEEWKETLDFLKDNRHLVDSILPLCYGLSKGSIAEQNREEVGIMKVYDEENDSNINIVFPNYIEALPNWKEREERYFSLQKLMKQEFPYFGASQYPKLHYGDFYKAGNAVQLTENITNKSDSGDSENNKKCIQVNNGSIGARSTYKIKKGYSVAKLPYDINYIKDKLKYGSSGYLPLKEIAQVLPEINYYIIDVQRDNWISVNRLHFIILRELMENNELNDIALKADISINKVRGMIKLLRVLYKDIFQEEVSF